jgi:hypothetical protein
MPATIWSVVDGLWTRSDGSGQTTTSPAAMVHPGVMYSEAQLQRMASDVNATGSNARKTVYGTLLTRTASGGTNAGTAYSSLSWTPHPVSVVKRYQSSSYTSVGDSDLVTDLVSALTHAMIWRLTGARASASKACQILNAWSSTITGIANGWPESANVAADGKLLAGWTASTAARVGEVLCYSGWSAGVGELDLNVANLKRVLRDIWQPILTPVEPIGQHNWHASVIDGAMQIAVFLDDANAFAAACDWWREIVQTVIWMPGDVNNIPAMAASTPPSSGLPRVPSGSRYNTTSVTRASILSYWQSPTSWPTGLSGELGRDFHHNAMIFALLGNAAETAYHQGVDLWSEHQARLVAGAEWFAGILRDVYVAGKIPPTTWPYAKTATSGSYTTASQRATWETLYMALAGRLGASMPNTAALLTDYVRTSTYIVDVGPGSIWCEGLTYRDNPGE